jgi:site-specific DNA recombinase
MTNRMTPSSAHKQGARYRYYVSAPLMQGRREQAGSVSRIPAPEIEQLVIDAVRSATMPAERVEDGSPSDRELVDQRLKRVEVRSGAVLIEITTGEDEVMQGVDAAPARSVFTVPWCVPPSRVRREVKVSPSAQSDDLKPMPSGHPEGLLVPIAKARRWFAELSSRQVASFAEIAARDGCSERYVRSILQRRRLPGSRSTGACPSAVASRQF